MVGSIHSIKAGWHVDPTTTTDEVSALLKDVKLTSKKSGKSKKRNIKALPGWMNQLRMDKASFDHLLKLVLPEFAVQGFDMEAEERLTLALKYLATGEGCTPSLEEIIVKTCLTFVEVLGEEYLKVSTMAIV